MSLTAAALGCLIGLVLAFTGAGGGILAIPLLVLGMHLPVQQAAPVGLAAVGIASAVGSLLGLREGVVRYRAAALIGLLGIIAAPIGVALAQRLPSRPLLAAFALVMAWVAWRMLRPPIALAEAMPPSASPCRVNTASGRIIWTSSCARALAATGALSGLLSGLLGVGGGFVIVPALTRHTDLDIRHVQATSLAVIALVSVSGLAAAAWHGSLDWAIALPFAGGATVALLIGRHWAQALPDIHLQRAFAWVSLAVAMLMLARAAGAF
jgi:uncharacterized membrane protein YfcA